MAIKETDKIRLTLKEVNLINMSPIEECETCKYIQKHLANDSKGCYINRNFVTTEINEHLKQTIHRSLIVLV